MAALPPEQRSSWKDLLLFLVKAVGMLAGIFAFGFLVFWMRRTMLSGH
jgi:NhaP-type Na+/H+ or K+/H+ antiporter